MIVSWKVCINLSRSFSFATLAAILQKFKCAFKLVISLYTQNQNFVHSFIVSRGFIGNSCEWSSVSSKAAKFLQISLLFQFHSKVEEIIILYGIDHIWIDKLIFETEHFYANFKWLFERDCAQICMGIKNWANEENEPRGNNLYSSLYVVWLR